MPTPPTPTQAAPVTATPAAPVGGLTPARSPSGTVAKPTAAARPAVTRPAATARPTATAPAASARPVATPRPAATARPTPVQPATAKTAAPLTAAQSWEQFFRQWPEGISQQGVVVNQLGEQIPFKGFMIRDDMVLLERTNPDTLGARFLISPFSEIGLVKLTTPINQATFEAAGYKGNLSV